MTHYFPSVFPDDSMFDLTPARLEALETATAQASSDAGKDGATKPIPRRRRK